MTAWTEEDYGRTCDVRDAILRSCHRAPATITGQPVEVSLGSMYTFAEPCGTLKLTWAGETYTISIKPDEPRIKAVA